MTESECHIIDEQSRSQFGTIKMRNNSRPTTLVVLGVLGLAIFAVAAGLYWLHFGASGISKSTEAWGQFGDFLAGTVGPPIAFLAFVGLLWTIHLNRTELRYTYNELKLSRGALEQNNEISERRAERERIESQKTDLFRVIGPLTKDMDALLEQPLATPGAVKGDDGGLFITRGLAVRDLCVGGPVHKARGVLFPRNLKTFEAIAQQIIQLHENLRAYERLAGHPFFTSRFKSKYHPVVTLLAEKSELIGQDILDYFQPGPDVLKLADESIAKAEGTRLSGSPQHAEGTTADISDVKLSYRNEAIVTRKAEGRTPRELPHVFVHTFPKPNDPNVRLAVVTWAYSSAPPGGVPQPALAVEKEPMSHEEAMRWGYRIANAYGFKTIYWQRDDY